MNMAVNITGMNISTFCCTGSPVPGCNRCCQNMLAPISNGVMYHGSRCDRSVIHPAK